MCASPFLHSKGNLSRTEKIQFSISLSRSPDSVPTSVRTITPLPSTGLQSRRRRKRILYSRTHTCRVHNTHERYDTSRQDIPSAPGLLPRSKRFIKQDRTDDNICFDISRWKHKRDRKWIGLSNVDSKRITKSNFNVSTEFQLALFLSQNNDKKRFVIEKG